jgi:hypothetical protein
VEERAGERRFPLSQSNKGWACFKKADTEKEDGFMV